MYLSIASGYHSSVILSNGYNLIKRIHLIRWYHLVYYVIYLGLHKTRLVEVIFDLLEAQQFHSNRSKRDHQMHVPYDQHNSPDPFG